MDKRKRILVTVFILLFSLNILLLQGCGRESRQASLGETARTKTSPATEQSVKGRNTTLPVDDTLSEELTEDLRLFEQDLADLTDFEADTSISEVNAGLADF
jgi:hypothetical protein